MELNIVKEPKEKIQYKTGDIIEINWKSGSTKTYMIVNMDFKGILRMDDGCTTAFFEHQKRTVDGLLDAIKEHYNVDSFKVYSHEEYKLNLVPKAVAK